MSRHEGVSCDSCLKGNFPGRRYKCLTCYDYDLCASCYEAGATTTRHTTEHPMQCILTRTDFELYYGGEALSTEQSQSFTCPFCGKMGFTETALQEHVNADHPDSTVEVVCPICAALPGGDPNLVTEDFAGHLALEHRPTPRDLISFLDEPAGTRPNARRIPHSTRGGIGGSRPRRSNMHFSSAGGISSLSPSGRDAVDPIAELLSQLSVVRRSNSTQGSASAQLQQLQMQLQLERQQVRAARQQLERFPRRQVHATTATAATSGTTSTTVTSLSNHVLAVSNAGGSSGTPKTSETAGNSNASAHAQPHSQLMLTKCMDTSLSEAELEALEVERADRSVFTQDALLNTLMATEDDDDDKYETKSAVRGRASPMQMPSQSPPQPSASSSGPQASAPPPPPPPSVVTQSSSAATSSGTAPPERPKNGQNESQQQQQQQPPPPHQHSVAACTKPRAQQRSSPQPAADRSTTATSSATTTTTCGSSQQQMLQQRTMAQQQQQQPQPNRIEYVLSPRSHQSPTGGTISVREVLVGGSYAGSDTARRKPICTVDTLTQTTEPPTSH